MWQIGVLTWKRCTFWPFWGVCRVFRRSHLKVLFMLEIPVENHILETFRQVEEIYAILRPNPSKVSPYFCSAKTPKMTDFRPKKCTVSLRERQFATLYLFHAYTGGGGNFFFFSERGPSTVRKKPLFDENALLATILHVSVASTGGHISLFFFFFRGNTFGHFGDTSDSIK